MTLSERTAIINNIASLPTGFVTLDGKPALIVGLACDFLTVITMALPRTQAEFSWQCVARIISNNGQFRSN